MEVLQVADGGRLRVRGDGKKRRPKEGRYEDSKSIAREMQLFQ